jgi:phosphinothricin acetyltransferase
VQHWDVVRVRAAEFEDLPAIIRIYDALLHTTTYEWTETPHTIEERTAWLEGKRAAALPAVVAVDGDEVVGWATYGEFRDIVRWPGYRFTVEHSIHVAESHWGRGVGRMLIAELEAHARAAGRRVMVAATDSSNVRSIEFHKRLGYVEVARMPGVGDKWGQRLTLVLLQHDL